MTIPKECEGCYTNSSCYTYSKYTEINAHLKCPCIKCLIKMICDNPCHEYHEFTINYLEGSEKYKHIIRKREIV